MYTPIKAEMTTTVLLLFLTSLVYADVQPLIFNRVDVTSDIHRHVYVKLYAHSKESVLMYTMVLFRSPLRQLAGSSANQSHDRYHNALLIGSHTYRKYYKMTKDSHFPYNNEIPLIARGVSFMIPFGIVATREAWDLIAKTSYTASSSGAKLDTIDQYDIMTMDAMTTSAMTYHAMLSLDRRSSIWDRYNMMTLTPYHMILRYEPDSVANGNLDEYGGLIRLQCLYTTDDDRCHIATHRLKLGDGSLYEKSTYRLIVDLHSASNYLPTHLYFHLKTLGASKATLSFENEDPSATPLYLNNVFAYAHNPYDNDIIIGVDLLHLFPKIELAIESGELHLWYFHMNHVYNDAHETVAIILTFLLPIALYCYFEFISNDPGFLFRLLLRYSFLTSHWFYFTARQVFIELTILVTASVIMIMTLFFTEFNRTERCQRTILFVILTFYHLTLLALILIVTKRVTRRAFGNTTGIPTNDRDFVLVHTAYLDDTRAKLCKEKTGTVIIRNTCLIVLALLSILMKLNFSSDDSYLHLVLVFLVSLVFLYFFVHQVTLAWLYWLSSPVSPRFLLFLCCETVALTLYITWSAFCVYMDYFRAVNSIYTEPFIQALTLVTISFVILFACRKYHSVTEDIIQGFYL